MVLVSFAGPRTCVEMLPSALGVVKVWNLLYLGTSSFASACLLANMDMPIGAV